jgi:hypothetical protein
VAKQVPASWQITPVEGHRFRGGDSKGFGVWGATLDESGTKDFKTTKARDLKCGKTLQHIAAPELGLVESELGVQGCSLVKAAAQRHQRDHAENRS